MRLVVAGSISWTCEMSSALATVWAAARSPRWYITTDAWRCWSGV